MQVLLEKRDQGHGDMIIGDKVRTLLEVGPCQKQNMKICVANVLMFTLVSYILSTALRLLLFVQFIGVGKTIIPIYNL